MLHHGMSSSTTTCGWIKVYPLTKLTNRPANTLAIGLGSHNGFAFHRFDPPMALSWLPINLGYEERDLLDHCKYNTRLLNSIDLTLAVICMASSTLAIFEPDKNEFLGLLVRLALSDSSPSSMAVLQSALALSSFHRHGLQADVFRFKARALRALVISGNHCIERPTVAQHISASMILCHLEVCSSMGLYLLSNKHSPALKMFGMPNAVSLWLCKWRVVYLFPSS